MQAFIFILDIDAYLCRLMSEQLRCAGFEVMEESDSGKGMARIMQVNPGAILLGEDMPPLSGMELLPLIRRKTSAPIIMLGKGNETAVVSSLLQGADMYIRKPVNQEEMVSRVRALIRRTEYMVNHRSPELDSATLNEVLPPSVQLSLTDTETRLFVCLMEKCGRVVGHEELMMKVWGKPVKKERLRFYVYSLRRKLDEAVPISLQTRNGVGYVLDRPAMQS